MPLAPGQALAHYAIVGRLGAGAMGEVWRAKDTRLDREVAIKVLPEHFADDEDRLRRFEREAKTLAALNHPNVAQIYGVDQIGDTCFLVLELVPGTSLGERLKRGPLPIDEAIEVCRQIAEGLDAAHEAGVVHRDLKPANVCLTPDGQAKVLDFGIAKLARGPRDASSTDGTLATEEGLVLGTPTYMAPEQARGKPVDRRADVWALGCVLYECLTGKRAFPGASVSDVLGAVLHAEPDLDRLPAGTPPRVRALLADCLAKDPRARVRDAGEVRRQLERARSEPAGAGPTSRASASKLVVIAVAVASALAAVFATRLVAERTRTDPRPPPTRFTITLPDIVAKPGDGIAGLALSPDGRSLAISSVTEHGGIYLRELGQAEARLLPGTETATDLCFSADGRSIAFFKNDVRSLWRIALDGGKPQWIRAQLYQAGIAWGPDGRIAIASPVTDSGLFALDPDDLTEIPLSKLDPKDLNHASPCFLPGGRAMLYTVWTGIEDAEGRIDVVDLATHEQRTAQRNATTPGYVRFSESEGALLFYRNAAYWARRFDLRTWQCRGDEVLLAEGVQLNPNVGEAMLAVSPTGTLAYEPRIEGFGGSQLLWVTRDGQTEPATAEVSDHQTPSLSADGKLLAYSRGGAVTRVYVVDLRVDPSERTPRRLNFESGISAGGALSPDGARIAYFSWSDAGQRVLVRDLARDEAPRVISVGDAFARSWSPDGRWLALMGPGAAGAEVSIAPADGSSPARPLVQVQGNAYDPQFSPDGRWVAYVSDEDGTPEVSVVAFPDGNRRVQVTNGGGASPRWARDGSELYFRKGDEFCAVPVTRQPELVFGTPRVMFRGEYDPSFFSIGFLPAPDGRFLMNKPLLPADRALRVVVVENFVEEVRAKLEAIEAR